MPSPFHRARPLQAGKLAVILLALPIGAAVVVGAVPYPGLLGLFLLPLLGLGLAAVVVAEALLAGYRRLRDERSRGSWFRERPLYGVVRAVEVALAVAAVVGLAGLLLWIPDGPTAGHGAIGVWMVLVGLALLVVLGCLLRTLAEVYYHRVGTAA